MKELHIQLSDDEHERLQLFARQQGGSPAECIRRFIRFCHIVPASPSITPLARGEGEVERRIDQTWWKAKVMGGPAQPQVYFFTSGLTPPDGWKEIAEDEVPGDVRKELIDSLDITEVKLP